MRSFQQIPFAVAPLYGREFDRTHAAPVGSVLYLGPAYVVFRSSIVIV